MNNILVLNSGSQSEKIAVFTREDKKLTSIYRGQVSIAADNQDKREEAIADLIGKSPVAVEQFGLVGHRIVHGGSRFQKSMLATQDVLAGLRQMNELAPLHNPPAIAGVQASIALFPNAKQILVFDTAFHSSMDQAHYLYPLPIEWQEYSIRKYGFHGTSHQFCSQTVAHQLGKDLADINMISCHLGGGSSVCAIAAGKSIDITMGFSPLDGVMMGTRCGAIDPAIIIYLLKNEKLTLSEIELAINKKSGMLGISKLSSDMQEIHKAIADGNAQASLAHKMFCLSIAKAIAAMTTNFSHLDAIAFTGGIGFHDHATRSAILPQGNMLGLKIDENLNQKPPTNGLISNKNSACAIFAVEANEELIIAQECLSLCL
ncbi:acetate/propionate family kinase [bacterium]|nr:acetate/propionate family kinase [bacterium]MBP9807360.1 acetate/propionate family kinase [bacterium]